jgi:hypothetical protein
MKRNRSNLLSLTGLILMTGTVFAGIREESDAIPVWRMRRINAVEWSERGQNGEPSSATDAFNYLQDQLGKPHVHAVLFHPGASFFHDGDDYFYWCGPKTGKRMTMSREKYFKEILFPWLNNDAPHPVLSSSPTPSS